MKGVSQGETSPLGTLCHFDFAPHEIAADEVEYLEASAPHILRELGRLERA